MKPNAFFESLPIVAAAIGRKLGVKVNIGGDSAFTDGETIHIPSIDLDRRPEAKELLMGFLDHEAGHVRNTDMDIVLKAAYTSPFAKHLLNILEDIRIEDMMGRLYPGCKSNLRKLVVRMKDMRKFQRVCTWDNPAQVLTGYLLHTLRCRILGQNVFAEWLDEDARVMEKIFPGLRKDLDPLAFAVSSTKSTEDVWNLTMRILDLLKKNQNPQSQGQGQSQEQEPQESGSEERDDSNGNNPDNSRYGDKLDGHDASGSDGSNGQEDSEQEDSGRNDSDGQASKDQNGSYEPNLSDKDPGNSPGGCSDEEMEKLAKSVKSALRAEEDSMQGDDLGDDLAKMLEGMVKGSVRPTAPAVPIKQEPSGSFDRMGIVAQSSNALRCRLQSLLQAETLQRSLPRELGSRLDARVAHRLLVGDLRVFKGKTEKKAVDTAVHLLLDVSRSMRGEKYTMAVNACASLALALEPIPHVDLGISFFPFSGWNNNVGVTKSHCGDRLNFNRFPAVADGNCTPLAQALWCVGQMMAFLPQPRKIVMVLTDGEPDSTNAAKDVLDKMRNAGFEVFGIGIQHMVCPDLFTEWRVVNNLTDLAPAVFGMLQKALLGANSKNLSMAV